MHSTLSSQLRALKLSDSVRQSITPLSTILDTITKAGQEDEGDQLTSTIEALRVIQTSHASQFSASSTTGGHISGDNSESSSEYTTPAQSQATSPLHDQSPPPPGIAVQLAVATVSTAAQVMTMQTADGEQQQQPNQGSMSPSTSPTHNEKVSRLVTHSHTAQTKQERNGGSNMQMTSDSQTQRHRVRPVSQLLPGTTSEHSRHTCSNDDCSIKYVHTGGFFFFLFFYLGCPFK